MAEAISGEARRELIRAVGERYRGGTREEKRRILDEFVAVTQWHRKHAIRVLNVEGCIDRQRRPRVRVYDDAVRQALLTLWEASDRVCAKRLRPLLPALIAALERSPAARRRHPGSGARGECGHDRPVACGAAGRGAWA
jgi:hypothetical protein